MARPTCDRKVLIEINITKKEEDKGGNEMLRSNKLQDIEYG
jgi:hypothetical protein